MRLIDADALLEDLKDSKKDLQEIRDGLKYDDEIRICDSEILTFSECIMRVKNAPTVDIKTEVAREIFAEIEKLISAKTHNYLLCGSRSQKSIEYGRQYTLRELNVEIAELKNKYIGGVGE
jgi:hypothetical protein